MYIIALKNLAEMANMTVTSHAPPRTDWRAKAAQVSGSHFFVTEGGFNIRANDVP